MKIIIFLLYISAVTICFSNCNKQNLCHTYPQDTVEICGKTHSILAGKLWQLDSVVLNGENITPAVLDTLNANAFVFYISENLEDGPSSIVNRVANAYFIIGSAMGDTTYSGAYSEVNYVLDELPIIHTDSR
jgi:hypothetical protein